MKIFVVLTFLFCSYEGLGSETCETELGFVFAADDPRLASCKGASCDGLGDAKDCPCKDLCCGENTFMWSLPGKRRFGQWGRCVSSSCVPHGGNELDGWGYCCPGLVPRNVGSWTRCVNSGCAASGSRDNDYIEGCCVGTYPDNGQCKTCPAGHSCPGPAKLSVPLDCPPGSEAAFDHSSCQLCEPGHYKLHADKSCQPCAPGTYSAIAGAPVCLACNAIGTYFNDGTGSSECVCREGFSGPGCDYVETPSSGKLAILELWEECIASEPSLSCSNSSLAFQLGCLSLRPRDGFAEMAAPIALNALNCLNDAFDRELVSSFLAQLRDALPEDLWQFDSLAPKRTTTAQPTIVSVDLGGKPVSVCSVHVETKHGRRVPLLSSSPLESDGCTAPASEGWTGSVELWDGEQVAAVVFDKHPSSSDFVLLGASVAVDGVAFGTVTDSPVQASVRVAGPALVNPADIDWVIVFDQSKACNVLTDLDRVRGAGATDALAQDTGFQQPIFRIKDGKDLSFIYKRLTPLPSKVSLRKNMLDMWSTKEGNRQGVDFALFASLEDALAEVNPVSPLDCTTEVPGFGFPGNCSQGFAQLSCDSTSSVKSVEVAVVQNRRPLAEHDLATAALSAIIPAFEMLQLFGPATSTYMGGPVDRSREGIAAKIKSTQFINGKQLCHIIPCVLGRCDAKGFRYSGSLDEVELGLAFARCTLIPDYIYNLVSIVPKYAMLNLAASVVFKVEDRPTGLTAMEEVRAIIQRVSAPSIDLPLRLANSFFAPAKSHKTIQLKTLEMSNNELETLMDDIRGLEILQETRDAIATLLKPVHEKLDSIRNDMPGIGETLVYISDQIMGGTKGVLKTNNFGAVFAKGRVDGQVKYIKSKRDGYLKELQRALQELGGASGASTLLLEFLDKLSRKLGKVLGYRSSLGEDGALGATVKTLSKAISGPIRIGLTQTSKVGNAFTVSTFRSEKSPQRLDVVAQCPSLESLLADLGAQIQDAGVNASRASFEPYGVKLHSLLSSCGCSFSTGVENALHGALAGMAFAFSQGEAYIIDRALESAHSRCSSTQSQLALALIPFSAQLAAGESAFRLAAALRDIMESTQVPMSEPSAQLVGSQAKSDPLIDLLHKARQRAMERAGSMAAHVAELNTHFVLLETGLLVGKNKGEGERVNFGEFFESFQTEILGLLFEAKVCSQTTLDLQRRGAMVNRASFKEAVSRSTFRSSLEGKTTLKEVTDVGVSQRPAFEKAVDEVWDLCDEIVLTLDRARRNTFNAQETMGQLVNLEREFILYQRAAENAEELILAQEDALSSLDKSYLKDLLVNDNTKEEALSASVELSTFLVVMNYVEATLALTVATKPLLDEFCQSLLHLAPEVVSSDINMIQDLRQACTEELRVPLDSIKPAFDLVYKISGVVTAVGRFKLLLPPVHTLREYETFVDITDRIDLASLKANNFSSFTVHLQDFRILPHSRVDINRMGVLFLDEKMDVVTDQVQFEMEALSPVQVPVSCDNGRVESFQVDSQKPLYQHMIPFVRASKTGGCDLSSQYTLKSHYFKTASGEFKYVCIEREIEATMDSPVSLFSTWTFKPNISVKKVWEANLPALRTSSRVVLIYQGVKADACIAKSPPGPTSQHDESSSLGVGTIAGIVVGISVALGVVVAAMVVHRRRQRRLREDLPTRTLFVTSFKGVSTRNSAHNHGADTEDDN